MKTIKDLTVTVTYKVGLGNIAVPDEVFKQLEDNYEITSDDVDNSEALEWLSSNIKEEDGYDLSYEIEDIEEIN